MRIGYGKLQRDIEQTVKEFFAHKKLEDKNLAEEQLKNEINNDGDDLKNIRVSTKI